MPKPTDYDKTHLRNLTAIGTRIDRIYKKAAEEAARIGASLHSFNKDKAFAFDDYPETKTQIDRLLNALAESTETVIVNGVRSSWTLSNNKNDEMSRQVFGDNVGKLTKEQYKRYFSTNAQALEAFIARKEQGLNLSDRVWRYSTTFKDEIEMGLDLGIRSGLDAPAMARELQQYLQHPDMLFRRVRDEHGMLHLSKRAADFHPGQGVYRSSYKNARRLAATETNIAYRTADHLRWQEMDFVVGIEIKLSNNHTLLGADGKPHLFTGICDRLAGRYPKDFKFTGWHPHCRCHAETILKTDEEIDEATQRILDGDEPSEESVNTVTDVPQAFKDHVEKYSEVITTADPQRQPYYIQDNRVRVDGILKGEAPTISGAAKKATSAVVLSRTQPTSNRAVKNPLPDEVKARRKEIETIAKKMYAGVEFTLPGIGLKATISNRGIKEWLNQPHVKYKEKNELLLNLQEVLSKSSYLGSGPDKHDESNTVHYYLCNLGTIIVRELFKGNLFIHSITEKDMTHYITNRD